MKFSHFCLNSMDVERSCTFYKALGGELLRQTEYENGEKGRLVKMAEGAIIEIKPSLDKDACGGYDGWGHLAFQVDNCEEACDIFEAAGGRLERRAVPNKTFAGAKITNAVAFGPDGEKIELMEFV